jgi:hypothetical protein
MSTDYIIFLKARLSIFNNTAKEVNTGNTFEVVRG